MNISTNATEILLAFPDSNVPELSSFLGTIIYFLSFFTCFNEIVESEELAELLKWNEIEYRHCPVYLCIGLFIGFLNYAFAYLQYPLFRLTYYGHTYLMSFAFYFFSRHLCRLSELPRKKMGMVGAFGVLPLICLGVVQAEHVSVRSCRFFYFLMLSLGCIPLGTLFREWRTNSFDVAASRPRKRLFFLYFALVCFIGSTTPSRACVQLHNQRHRDVYVILFDLVTLYISADAMWGGSGQSSQLGV
jgi:hypothetical protein